MANYFKSWRLKLNLSKTAVNAFHLNNQMASRSLNIKLKNVALNHNFNPKMLGITLDRSLTYRVHLEQKTRKLLSRMNLLQQLAGTSWGASAESLKTAALSLVFSMGEYCCPVFENCNWNDLIHSHPLDPSFIHSPPIPWLPVLSNISPPDVRRKPALADTMKKSMDLQNYLLFKFTAQPVPQALSRFVLIS